MQSTQLKLHASVLALAASMMAPGLAQAQTPPAQTPPAQPAQPTPGQTPPAQTPPANGERKGDIVVTGARSEVISSPDRVSFSVANDLQVQTGTLADALRAVPGVGVDLQGNVTLRGDPGVTILIDGRPSAQLNGDSRGDAVLAMPAGQIERVEVISNPSAAMSPEGSAGVINLVSRQARRNTRSGTARATIGTGGTGGVSLSGSQSGSGLTLAGDLGFRRFAGEANATQIRSRLDPLSGTFITSSQESEIENVMTSRSGRIAADYDLDKKNRLSTELSYRDGSGDVERTDNFTSQSPSASYDRISDIDLFQRGISGRASWRRTLPGKDHEFAADLQVENGRFRREVEGETIFLSGPSAYERISNAGRRSDYTLKLDYKKATGEGGSLNLGYQGNVSQNEFDYFGARGASFAALVPVAGLTNEFEYDQTIHALYGTYNFDIGKLDIQTGLRLEQAELTINQITDSNRIERDYFRAYPTLHLSYELSKTEQLRASYSRRIQRPSPNDLNPYVVYIDPLNQRRGNPFLVPEVTDSFELAFQKRKGPAFYSLTGFYRHSDGGVTDILSDLGGGVFLTTRANLATATRTGVEAIANGKLSKTLSYNTSATFLWNKIDPRTGGVSQPRSGTTGTVRTNLSWQPTPRDFFQLNAVYSGKQLLPQGYRTSGGILNLGYRRKVNDRLSFLLTTQDILDSARQTVVFDTPTIHDRITQRGVGRMVLFGLAYNLGSQGNRKKPDPAFEFQQGGGDIPQ